MFDEKFGIGAKFDYLMANKFIYNYICKKYQTVFYFLYSFLGVDTCSERYIFLLDI